MSIKLEKKRRGKIFRAAIEKQPVTYKGTLIKITADFSSETMEAKRW